MIMKKSSNKGAGGAGAPAKAGASDKPKKKSSFSLGGKKASATSSKSVIGLDVSDNTVKMVHVTGKDMSKLKLEGFAVRDLPTQSIVDGKVQNLANVVGVVQNAARAMNTKTAVVGLPTNLVTTLNFNYDANTGLDLEKASEYEVSQVANVDDVNFDFFNVAKNDDGTDFTMIVMAKVEDSEMYKTIASESGLQLSYLDLELAGRINAFTHWINNYQPNLSNSLLGLFDIGESVSQALFVQAGKILFKQEFTACGRVLTRDIQRNQGISFEEAERIKRSQISSGGAGISDLVAMYRGQVASEIQRVMQFFNTVSTASTTGEVEQLLITGGGSICPGLAEEVANATGIGARCVHPVSSIQPGSKINAASFEADAPRLTSAFGLALRGLL